MFDWTLWIPLRVGPIEGNVKHGVRFWGVIADTNNNTTKPHHHLPMKNLKDHWCTYNNQVSLFNQIYNKNPLTGKAEPTIPW
jgi:hypothetical protein